MYIILKVDELVVAGEAEIVAQGRRKRRKGAPCGGPRGPGSGFRHEHRNAVAQGLKSGCGHGTILLSHRVKRRMHPD
jgi:hypothetical protein